MILLAYIAAINTYSYKEMREDKEKSIHDEWRTSEQDLLFLAIIGGAVGTELAMYDFPSGENKHKISKACWRIGVPSLILNHLFILYFLFRFLTKKKEYEY